MRKSNNAIGTRNVRFNEVEIEVLGQKLCVSGEATLTYNVCDDKGDYWTPSYYEEELEDVEINELYVFIGDDENSYERKLTTVTNAILLSKVEDYLYEEDFSSFDLVFDEYEY